MWNAPCDLCTNGVFVFIAATGDISSGFVETTYVPESSNSRLKSKVFFGFSGACIDIICFVVVTHALLLLLLHICFVLLLLHICFVLLLLHICFVIVTYMLCYCYIYTLLLLHIYFALSLFHICFVIYIHLLCYCYVCFIIVMCIVLFYQCGQFASFAGLL